MVGERTTATLVRVLGWAAAACTVLAWGALLAADKAGRVAIPHASAVILGLPVAIVAVLVLLRRPLPRQVLWAAAGLVLLSYGLLGAERLVPKPLLVLALPAGIAAGLACRRRPWIAVLALFVVSSAYGSIDAFTPVPPSKLADLLLAGLWLGVAWRWIVGERFAVQVFPGVLLLLGFAVITLAQVVAAPSLSFGMHTFVSTGLYLLTVLLVGLSEMDERRLAAIGKGIVAVAVLVASYAVLRHVIGPAAQEREIAARQPFNYKDGKLLLVGSFESRHQLGQWCALVVPFCAGMAAVLRGRWRIAALAVIPLCAVAFVGSEARAALVGAIAGLLVVLTLFSMGRAFPGPRLGAVVGALVVIAGGGGAAIVLSGGNGNATTKKFTVVLHPNDDAAYQARRAKWDETLRDIRTQPMGYGLGTANQLQQQQGRFVSIGSFSIDNSYLRIGYEQGIVPALLYIAGLLTLALGLVRRAIATPDPARAGPALAAAGALVSYIVVLYPSNAFDGFTALTAWLLAGVGIAPFLAERRAVAAPARSALRGDRRARSAAALG
ncbi:MAG: hypothetical protein QOH62_981 [Solirubrobacteraceae bacterium]|nr:hypothetical protein [Solirubrobacteraceae bacterium]